MPPHETDQLLQAATEAVALASQVTRSVQQKLDRVRSITKDDASPVTVGDFAAQAVVAHHLTQKLGSIVLVGEESSSFLREPEHSAHLEAALDAAQLVWPDATRDTFLEAIDLGTQEPNSASGFWTLDPIDGTKGFLRGQHYAIALAFIEGQGPTVAAMATPNLSADLQAPLNNPDPIGTVFAARTGRGVTQATTGAEPGQLRDRREDSPRSLRVCASSEKAHNSSSKTDQIATNAANKARLENVEHVKLDSQAKYAVVARGQADAYLRLPRKQGYVERIWDHAAGALIAQEAGCAITDIAGKKLDFSYGRGLEQNEGIVCAPPMMHELLLQSIASLP